MIPYRIPTRHAAQPSSCATSAASTGRSWLGTSDNQAVMYSACGDRVGAAPAVSWCEASASAVNVSAPCAPQTAEDE